MKFYFSTIIKIEDKSKLARIGVEFYGENNNYKVKIRIGEDLNIQSIEKVEQTVSFKTIKSKKIQMRKRIKPKSSKIYTQTKKYF
jgi:hypothetical protein